MTFGGMLVRIGAGLALIAMLALAWAPHKLLRMLSRPRHPMKQVALAQLTEGGEDSMNTNERTYMN